MKKLILIIAFLTLYLPVQSQYIPGLIDTLWFGENIDASRLKPYDFSPDGSKFIAAYRDLTPPLDSTVYAIYNTTTGAPLDTLFLDSLRRQKVQNEIPKYVDVRKFVWSPDGRYIAILAHVYPQLTIFNASNGEVFRQIDYVAERTVFPAGGMDSTFGVIDLVFSETGDSVFFSLGGGQKDITGQIDEDWFSQLMLYNIQADSMEWKKPATCQFLSISYPNKKIFYYKTPIQKFIKPYFVMADYTKEGNEVNLNEMFNIISLKHISKNGNYMIARTDTSYHIFNMIDTTLTKKLPHRDSIYFVTFVEDNYIIGFTRREDLNQPAKLFIYNWQQNNYVHRVEMKSDGLYFYDNISGNYYFIIRSEGISDMFKLDKTLLSGGSIVRQRDNSDIKHAYPIPVKNELTVELEKNPKSVDIYSSDGKKRSIRYYITEKGIKLNLDGINNGQYTIIINYENSFDSLNIIKGE